MDNTNKNNETTPINNKTHNSSPKLSYYFTFIVLYGINPFFINFFLAIFAFSTGLNLYFVAMAAFLVIIAYIPISKSIIKENPNIKLSLIFIVVALSIFALYTFDNIICELSLDPCDSSETNTPTNLFMRYFWHLLVLTILVLSKYRYQKTQNNKILVN